MVAVESAAAGVTVTVVVAFGTVASVSAGKVCGVDCAESFGSDTAVTLTATPGVNSVFTGWLGACIGKAPCSITVSGPTSVGATFAPSNIGTPRVEIDGNASYDALTDGLLMLRAFFGLTGSALTSGAIGRDATIVDSTQLLNRMNDIRPIFDVDGNGQVDALTDGILFIRYLFGLRGQALIAGAIGTGATRTTALQIEAYIQSVTP